MSRAYALEALAVALERARRFAVAAKLDEHFVSDINHLLAVTKRNKEIINKDTAQ